MKGIHVIMTLQLSENNDRLLLIFTLVASIIISIPLVMNHVSHAHGVIHLVIHSCGFVLASFLTVVALISWRKTKIARMIFSGFAFAALALAQGVYMYLEKDTHEHWNLENEIFDILIVIVTILFAVGVFYKR